MLFVSLTLKNSKLARFKKYWFIQKKTLYSVIQDDNICYAVGTYSMTILTFLPLNYYFLYFLTKI